MTVALAGRAPTTFEIKSANLPLVALLLKSTDLSALAAELTHRFGDIPDFFDNDALVLDLSLLQGSDDASIDFESLITLLRGYCVMPVAARGGSITQMQAASRAGLAAAPDAWMPDQVRHDKPAGTSNPSLEPAASTAASPPAHALIIDKPLRSGQQVYARGRDLVMLSMVNPGAEVIADGNIHVYAPLRGKAIAGARGNTEARIISLCLEAELLSIAGVYRTSEIALPKNVLSKPTQVRLVGGAQGNLVMDPIK